MENLISRESAYILLFAIIISSINLTIIYNGFLTNTSNAQIVPKNNTQDTSPNNKTSIMIIINHGAANYTISDFIPTMLPDKCPLTAHVINNNNISTTDSIPAKPVIICYI